MIILVSDTSVLIDLERGSLLELAFSCGLVMVVPDLLYTRELASEKPYRLVELLPLEQVPVLEIDLEPARQRIKNLFAESSLSRTAAGQQFARLVRSHLSTPEIADLAAFTFVDDVAIKQSLLAETDIRHRIERTIELLTTLSEATTFSPVNPSMN